MAFSEKVKQLREEKGLTQAELANLIGVALKAEKNHQDNW